MSTTQGTTEGQIAKLRKTFAASLSGKVAQNVVAHSTFPDCTLNREVLQNTDHTFDVQLDDWAVTNQKSSGRCWLFALLNMLRVGTMKKMKVKQFEFSQNWLFFWDKFNRSDAFMTAMIQESDKDVGDRTVSFMLNDPISDGGQWDMAINLIRKHGLVPKYAYPESVSSSASRFMNVIDAHTHLNSWVGGMGGAARSSLGGGSRWPRRGRDGAAHQTLFETQTTL